MKTLVVLSAFVLLLSACKKDPDQSKTKLLTEGAWKFIKIEYEMNGLWIDEVSFWPPCKKDDEIVFMKDHSYILRNGATKCSSSDPDTFDVVRWNFLDDETKLDMDGAVTAIEVLNHSQLILSATQTTGGITSSTKYTLEH
jgi:hypothetical protein